MVSDTLQVLDNIATTLLTSTVPGEPSATLNTSALTLVLSRYTAEGLQEETLELAGQDGSTLAEVLPPVFPGEQGVISTQVC